MTINSLLFNHCHCAKLVVRSNKHINFSIVYRTESFRSKGDWWITLCNIMKKTSKSPTSHTVTSELSVRDHYTFLGDVLLVEYMYSWNYYLFILQRIVFSFLTFSCDTEIEFLRITFSFRSYDLRLQIPFSVWCIWDSTTIWISLWLKNVLYPTHLHHWLKLLDGPRSRQMFWIL